MDRNCTGSRGRRAGRHAPRDPGRPRSDIYDVFVAAQTADYDVCVRGAWDRRLVDHPAGHLWSAVEAGPVLGPWTIALPRKEDHPLRSAQLTGRVATVTMAPPAHRRAEHLPPVTITGVLARELDPPADTDPIEWLLLTTVPVATFDDARTLVQWYPYRWRIERLRFLLKTGGSQVEKLQLETFDRLRGPLPPSPSGRGDYYG